MVKKAPDEDQSHRGASTVPNPLDVARLLWREAQYTSPAIALLTGIPLNTLTEQLGDRQLAPSQTRASAKIIRASDVAPLTVTEMAAILANQRVQHSGNASLIPDWRERAMPLWANPALSVRKVSDAIGVSPDKLTRELGARHEILGWAWDASVQQKPDPARLEQAREMWADPAVPVRLIADATGIGAAVLYAELGSKPGRDSRQKSADNRLKQIDPELREKAREMWDNPELTQSEIARALTLPVAFLRRELGFRSARQARHRVGKRPPPAMTAEVEEQVREMWTDPSFPMHLIVATAGISAGRLQHILGKRLIRYRRKRAIDPALVEKARKLWADPTMTSAQVAKRSGVPLHILYRTFGPRGHRKPVDPGQVEQARKLWLDPTTSIRQVVNAVGLGKFKLESLFGPRPPKIWKRGGKPPEEYLSRDQLELARKLWADPTTTMAQVVRAVDGQASDFKLRSWFGPKPTKRGRKSQEQLELAHKLWADPTLTIPQIAAAVGIDPTHLYRIFGPRGIKRGRR